MITAIRAAPHHNTLTCYTDYRCRQPECVERYRSWYRERGRAIANGTWLPLLDAAPVRQHLLDLHAAGITIYRVAALTGLTYKSVRGFTQHDYGNTSPRRYRTTREVAAKILAINTEDHTPGLISPIGSQRRFQALVAIGWPTLYIAPRAGLHPSNRNTIFRAPQMRASTAQRITEAYDEMRHQRPARHGVSATSIKRSKKRAVERRWPKPAYWDEAGAIDDPDFHPLYRVPRLEILAGEGRWLVSGGTPLDDAAVRLGITVDYLQQALREHPEVTA